MDRDPRYDILFEPLKIGPVTAPNRFYAVPHATGHGHLQPNGAIALREMKARGGWGVVSMQITEIGPDSDFANHPMERIWDNSDQASHVRLVEHIKTHGALAAIELGHGGMRCRNLTTGLPVIGPSDLPVIRPEVPVQARAMDKKDIKAFRQAHLRAAQAAKAAGYDIIYVYAAHDLSILSHFLSRRTNQRNDEYGGSLENRVRLLREVIEDSKEAVGDHCAIALRFSVEELGAELALTHDGEGRDVIEMLAELPDLWDVNISGWSSDSATSRFAEEGFQLDYTAFVKSVTSKPVVGVGRYTSPDRMVSLIKSGTLDLIGAARPSIADPFLPEKIREGRIDDIRECIGCNICVSCDSYGIPLRCTQNPTISEEWRREWHPEIIPKTNKKQKILFIGAGPAGLECGLTLARAGHQVTIADASEKLGGRVTREANLSGLAAWSRVRDYRVYQLQQLANVEIFLQSPLQAVDVKEFAADHVVIATGARWRNEGVGSSRYQAFAMPSGLQLKTPDDVMNGTLLADSVIIYDDEHFYMGGVIAEHLRKQGKEVHLITPLTQISAWTENTLEQAKIMRRLINSGIQWRVNWTLDSLETDRAQFVCSYSGEPVGELEFGSFVMVGARIPDNALYYGVCETLGSDRVTAIGDCLVPGTIQAAVYSGHQTARLLNGDVFAAEQFKREQSQLLI